MRASGAGGLLCGGERALAAGPAHDRRPGWWPVCAEARGRGEASDDGEVRRRGLSYSFLFQYSRLALVGVVGLFEYTRAFAVDFSRRARADSAALSRGFIGFEAVRGLCAARVSTATVNLCKTSNLQSHIVQARVVNSRGHTEGSPTALRVTRPSTSLDSTLRRGA